MPKEHVPEYPQRYTQDNWCITSDVAKRKRTGYRGPAKVIAVEKGEDGRQVTVAWLSHGGTLIRASPEHLRMATPLETRTHDVLAGIGFIHPDQMAGSRYVDLGAIPTVAEERSAQHFQFDEPPQKNPVRHPVSRFYVHDRYHHPYPRQ